MHSLLYFIPSEDGGDRNVCQNNGAAVTHNAANPELLSYTLDQASKHKGQDISIFK